MSKKLFLIFVLTGLTIFIGCKKESNLIGYSVIDPNELEILYLDNLPVNLSIIKEDSLSSFNTPTSYLGKIFDENFGYTKASIYTEIRLSNSNVNFNESLIIDSVILSLKIADFYGDSLSNFDINVNQVLENIENDDNIFSDQNYLIDNQFFYQGNHLITPNSEKTIKLKLDNLIAESFINSDSSNFADNSSFRNFFNGLYLSSNNNSENGLLLELDLLSSESKLTMYFHSNDLDTIIYDFQINSSCNRLTNWENDYSNSQVNEQFLNNNLSLGYIQGGAGIRSKINFPTIYNLKDSNFVIHKAEIIIPYISTNLDSIFPPPNNLGLASIDDEENLSLLYEDQSIQGSIYFDGNINVSNKNYKFNISRYIHDVVENDRSSKLIVYVPYSVTNPNRVIINNFHQDSIGIKLKLYLSR